VAAGAGAGAGPLYFQDAEGKMIAQTVKVTIFGPGRFNGGGAMSNGC
jgi:hypothetical protein